VLTNVGPFMLASRDAREPLDHYRLNAQLAAPAASASSRL
jgi:hypothetical protein